jgi:cellulose synthase/poly-beta-1,6-N-acetylglucosamine synthase-like glycosyltransferase
MNVWYNMMLYGIWFVSTYYVVVLILIMLTGKDKLYERRKFGKEHARKVSVLVPAYNEEKKIGYTIKSLKRIKYDNIEFIIINDGSKDDTSKAVRKEIKNDKRFIFIDSKVNKGKAASLNIGIARATGEFIATMDADSVVEPRIFQKVLPYFEDRENAAVTVSVLVKNPKTILHKVLELEYIIGLSLFLKVFSMFDSVFVTPGPFSIYRKSVLDEINGFDETNMTEDLEIAYRIQKKKYKIANCLEARVYTILPPTFKKICTQRKRWYSGAIYTLSKHRNMMLNNKYGVFGYFVFFNYLLIFLGLVLFGSSLYLLGSKIIDTIIYYNYTGFDIIQQLTHINWDILNYSRASILATVSFLFTISILILGLLMTKTNYKNKKIGIIGYPYLFIFYQIFWVISIYAVIRGKRIKWR